MLGGQDDIQLAEAIPVLVDEWQQALLEHKAPAPRKTGRRLDEQTLSEFWILEAMAILLWFRF